MKHNVISLPVCRWTKSELQQLAHLEELFDPRVGFEHHVGVADDFSPWFALLTPLEFTLFHISRTRSGIVSSYTALVRPGGPPDCASVTRTSLTPLLYWVLNAVCGALVASQWCAPAGGDV